MQLSERAAYISGLIEGLELDPKDKQTKVFKLIAELLCDMAEEIKDLEQSYDDVCDQVDGIGEDLAGVEDLLNNEEYEGGLHYSKSGSDSDLQYETTCPSCETVINIGEEVLNAGTIKCPSCGEILKFDYEEDELDDDEDESEEE